MAVSDRWSRFFGSLLSFVESLETQNGFATEAFCEYAVDRLELCVGSLSIILRHLRTPLSPGQVVSDTSVMYSTMLSELLECLRLLYRQWGTYHDSCIHGYTTHGSTSSSFRAPLAYTGNVGRPRFHVTQQYLRSMSFSWVQIAQILSISTMTLYRRRVEFNMVGEPSGVLTDFELHFLALRLQNASPRSNHGLGSVEGYGIFSYS